MTSDPLDDALQHGGIDPSPAFQSGLESLLGQAFDGAQISTTAVVPSVGIAQRRRIMVSAAAAVLVAAAIVGVIVLRPDSGGTSIVNAPTPDTPVPSATTVAPSTTVAPASTVAPSTTVAPASTTTAAPATTAAAPSHIAATVDLGAAATRLEPKLFASLPITPPGDLFPTAYATTAGSDRVAVLDDVTGVVEFIDGTTRMEITQYPTNIPTIGSPSFIAGYFFVGPDDVLYVNEGSPAGGPAVVAYGRTGDTYVEIARTPHGVGDSALTLGRTGISVVGANDTMMPYVGVDGKPSGATIDVDNLTLTSDAKDVYTLQRANRSWTVTYTVPTDAGLPPSDTCVLCPSAFLGPNNTVVLSVRAPAQGGDLQTKISVLGDDVTTYDTDWNYIGTLGGQMLFDRLDQDSIDIGTVAL